MPLYDIMLIPVKEFILTIAGKYDMLFSQWHR